MIQNKLIRAKNGNENTSNFTTYLDPPIVLSENSAIALQSFNMELTPNIIDFTSETQKFSFATVKTTAGAYDDLIKEHTFTIPVNTYTLNNLAYNLTIEGNKQLFFEDSNSHSKEQGAELKFYHDEASEKISFIWAGRQASEFCGTPVDKVAQTNPAGTTYEYTLVNTAGTVKRVTNDNTEFDFYNYSTIPFCRGSGQIEIDLTSSANNFVIGLINPLHLLSNPSSNTILQKIKYGVMLLDDTSTYDVNNFPQEQVLLKTNEDGSWDPTFQTSADTVTITLGKQSAELAKGYQLFIDIDQNLYNIDYDYGNYVLICGTYTDNNTLTYKITETKLGATTTTAKGYYEEVNPKYININPNNFIDLDNVKYNNDQVGYIPNQSSYVTLNLFNEETAQLFGFNNEVIESDDILAAQDNVINITPENKIDARYQFPDSFKLVVDLPLDCYDDGKNQNILCFIPNIIIGKFITYQPSPPLFITLKNNKSLYLDHISFKLYDSNNILLPNQVSSSAILILQSIK